MSAAVFFLVAASLVGFISYAVLVSMLLEVCRYRPLVIVLLCVTAVCAWAATKSVFVGIAALCSVAIGYMLTRRA